MTAPFDRNALQTALKRGNIEWRKHVLVRLLERNIPQSRVFDCLAYGLCIQAYPEDTPI